jgi:hypothetical protein
MNEMRRNDDQSELLQLVPRIPAFARILHLQILLNKEW